MRRIILGLSLILAHFSQGCSGNDPDCCALPEPYISFFTGDTADVSITPTFGITMMGGRSEHDNAMRWFLQRANGGDILVLRASGSDGYNNYLFSELGVNVNSVETLVINNIDAAHHAYVLQQIANAEAIWIAGGDQSQYYTIWGNSPMKKALNEHINIKRGVIGGTSAGMAILGEWAYTATNGSVISSEALGDPFDTRITLSNDFLKVPFLENLVTDTHYHERNREGRHSAFMARIANQTQSRVYGIACDEYAAVCIGEDGQARVYGNAPNAPEAVYFIQSNCHNNTLPEVIETGEALTWNQNNQALYVYKVTGNTSGNSYFNLNTWSEGTGGEWLNWYVEQGSWNSLQGQTPSCN